METSKYPSATPRHESRPGDLWGATPLIDGFNAAECSQIYSGDYEKVLNRFRGMNGPERDRLIITLAGELGGTARELCDLLEIALDEWKDQDRAKAYNDSLKMVLEFEKALFELYQQEDLPEDQRDPS